MARNSYSVSIPKFEANVICEDAAASSPSRIVISDGSGGGGVYAEKWSRYLVDSIPSIPIRTFEDLDRWIAGIWEPYYQSCESMAKQTDGMTLRKFYEEGSFATIAAAWKIDDKAYWVTYGDSVVFHYIKDSGILEWSTMRLTDFKDPPYLIGCSTPLKLQGFHSGQFELSTSSILFAASDALAHYIIMMFEVVNRKLFNSELTQAVNAHTKESSYIKAAMGKRRRTFSPILGKILSSSRNRANFFRHMEALYRRGLIANDDYSFTYVIPECSCNNQ